MLTCPGMFKLPSPSVHMDARFRAIDSSRNDLGLLRIPDVVDAIAKGLLTADSMLFDAQTQKWARIGHHDIYAAFIASLESSEGSTSGNTSASEGFSTGLGDDPPERQIG